MANAAKKMAGPPNKIAVQQYAEEHQMPEEDVYADINRFGQVEEEAIVQLTKESCLKTFMNCMPVRYRAVFTLRSILHCSVDETAEILEISRAAVKTNLYRAR